MALTNRLKQRRAHEWSTPDSLPWRKATFSVIDIETTGLHLVKDEILSIGVVHIRGGRIGADSTYEVCSPSRAISPEAMKVHCLTTADLADAANVEDVTGSVAEHLKGTVIVAHAAWVERAFLNRALRSAGQKLPRQLVDTAALARAAKVVDATDREPSLEALAMCLNVPVHTPHHALGDAATTAVVLLALIARLQRSSEADLTTGDLLRLSRDFGLG